MLPEHKIKFGFAVCKTQPLNDHPETLAAHFNTEAPSVMSVELAPKDLLRMLHDMRKGIERCKNLGATAFVFTPSNCYIVAFERPKGQ